MTELEGMIEKYLGLQEQMRPIERELKDLNERIKMDMIHTGRKLIKTPSGVVEIAESERVNWHTETLMGMLNEEQLRKARRVVKVIQLRTHRDKKRSDVNESTE